MPLAPPLSRSFRPPGRLVWLYLLLWSPAVLAFPPCPKPGLNVLPIGSDSAGSEPPTWDTVHYALVGNPDLIAAIDASSHLHAGKCRDSDVLPIPGPHISDGTVGLAGRLAPAYGAGVLSLPVPETLMATDQLVEYRLYFVAGQGSGPQAGEWLDLAQLQLTPLHAGDKGTASAIYRVRRHYHAGGGQLQVIEVRAPEPPSKPESSERIVASVHLPAGAHTPMSLRWRQWVGAMIDPCAQLPSTHCNSFPVEPPETLSMRSSEDTARYDTASVGEPVEWPLPTVLTAETTVEVLGPDDRVLYTAELSDQWAEVLLMGLLDFSVSQPTHAAEIIGAMSLEARTLP